MKKTLMSPEDLVLHMRDRGIQFNIMSHTETVSFLTNNNYYKKLSCYKKIIHGSMIKMVIKNISNLNLLI